MESAESAESGAKVHTSYRNSKTYFWGEGSATLGRVRKYRNTEIITVRVLDEAQHCGKTLLTLEKMYRSRMAISYDSVGFYHIACGV